MSRRRQDTLNEILGVLQEIRDLLTERSDVEASVGFDIEEEEDDDEWNEEIECDRLAKAYGLGGSVPAGTGVLVNGERHPGQCTGSDRLGHSSPIRCECGQQVHQERKWR